MGNYFTISMEENFKKNLDFISEINHIKIERQIHMRNQLREREVALQIAKQRELFFWIGAFYITSVAGAVYSYRNKGKASVLLPLVPLTFVYAYQADLAYGRKNRRILAEAERILKYEEELVAIPLGVPTPSSIDVSRTQESDRKKLYPRVVHF